MWDYSKTLKDHFLNPRNVGEIKDPDGVGEVGSLACGDALKLMFKLNDEGRIGDIKFQTFGCASAIASSSALTEMAMGKTIEEAGKITNKDIADYLGGMPEEKMHCSVMGREALEKAIANCNGEDSGGVAQLEGRVVCTCFGVTEPEIRRAISENGLVTVEQVTHYTKAGGGCGQCEADIEGILAEILGTSREEVFAQEKPEKKRLTNIQKMQLVMETIEREIRPTLKRDGGDVDLIDIDGDTVIVALRGTCTNCPSAALTLSSVVEAKLREFVSDSLRVEVAS
ncbi:Fe-S cluster assembly protein NifU [Candidatus Hydrogenedentota bacterium]